MTPVLWTPFEPNRRADRRVRVQAGATAAGSTVTVYDDNKVTGTNTCAPAAPPPGGGLR